MVSSHTDASGSGTFEVDGIELDTEDLRKARILYDYEAENDGELTVSAGEVYVIVILLELYYSCIDSAHLLHPFLIR